jgi:hypothetical protein
MKKKAVSMKDIFNSNFTVIQDGLQDSNDPLAIDKNLNVKKGIRKVKKVNANIASSDNTNKYGLQKEVKNANSLDPSKELKLLNGNIARKKPIKKNVGILDQGPSGIARYK